MFMLSKILGIIPLQQISLSIPPPDKSSTGPVPIPGFFIARLNPPTAYFRSILCRKAQSNKGLLHSHGGERSEPRCAFTPKGVCRSARLRAARGQEAQAVSRCVYESGAPRPNP